MIMLHSTHEEAIKWHQALWSEKNERLIREIKTEYESKLKKLKEELAEAKDFKELMTILAEGQKSLRDDLEALTDSAWTAVNSADFIDRENIATLVDDYYGGQVLAHEATKLVEIDEDGDVSYHWTKLGPDEGLSYRLVLLRAGEE